MINSKSLSLIISVLISSLIVGFLVFAWTEPSQTPPAGNVDRPLNTGSTPQSKSGSLTFPAFYDFNNNAYFIDPSAIVSALFSGTVGIGTTNPDTNYKLDITGKIKTTELQTTNLCLGTECKTSWPSVSAPVGFETKMTSERKPNDKFATIVSASGSGSESGKHTPGLPYRRAYVRASCGGWSEANYWSNASVSYAGAGASVSCWDGGESGTPEGWAEVAPESAYDWSYSMSRSYWGSAEVLIRKYETGYKILIELKNTDPYPQPSVPVGVYVVAADGSAKVLGKKELTQDFAVGQTITISPEYTDGTTFPTKEYVIDAYDSSNQEYYIVVKVYNYLTIYRQKVKWTFDILQLIQ